MAKAAGSDEGVTLPADGSAVAVEKTEKKIVRRARPDEVGGNGNGHGGTDDWPTNPLIGHAGGSRNADPNRIVAVKLYKGTSSKSGVHVTTIDGEEIANVDEDYIRGNFAPEWGFGPYYLQGINRKGQPVAEGGQMVNIGSPKGAAATPSGNGHGDNGQLMALMQSQLAQQQTLLLAMVNNANKGSDGGSASIVAEMVKANTEILKAITTQKPQQSDPALTQFMADANARAAASDQRAHEMMLRLTDKKDTQLDPGGMANKVSTAMGAVLDLIPSVVALKSGTPAHPSVEIAREIGGVVKEVVRETTPYIAGAFRKATPAPPPAAPPALPPANRVFRVTAPPPKPSADAPRGDPEHGAPHPANPPAAETPSNRTDAQPQPGGQAMTELQAIQEIDAAIREDGYSPEDVAGLFVKHATVTKVFPAYLVGTLALMNEDALSRWPKRLTAMFEYDLMHWASEPFWTKLRSAMVPLREYVQQETEREARAAAEAAAQGAAPR